jgi:2-(1,2-epoxy-1,2-dihydrophenyl)acetyl-CoA isomerase
MTMEAILLEKTGPVALVTLNQPSRLNALGEDMLTGFLEILQQCESDGTTRAMVVTGAGRGFCTGVDLMGLEENKNELGRLMRESGNVLIKQIYHAPFPVIAAINGPVAGAGLGIALASDFVLSAKSAQFVFSFASVGMALDLGLSWFLPRLVGQKRAIALTMLAETLDAETAREWGLVWRVYEDNHLQSSAQALAKRLADGPTLAYSAQKEQLRRAMVTSLTKSLDFEADTQARLVDTADVSEGVASFREGRPPSFTGS